MANLPITSRVLKSSKGGMKVTDPILNVGTVTKQTNVNLSGTGGSATVEEQIKTETNKVAAGNSLENVKIDEPRSEGPGACDKEKKGDNLAQNSKKCIEYKKHKETEKTDPCYQYKNGNKSCPEGTVLNPSGATGGDRSTCCAKKTQTCPDGSQPDADGNCTQTSESKKEVITDLTPETDTIKGMSNFQARQQGRKGIQNERKLKRFKIRDAKIEAKQKGLKGKEKRDFIKNAKLEAKRVQNQANIQNFENMSKTIGEQSAQGSSGTRNMKVDKYLAPNEKLYTKQPKVDADGDVVLESASDVLNRVNAGDQPDKPKTDYTQVFKQMSENLANKNFSLNNSDKPKPTTFFGSGDDKPTFKDVISGIGDNLVGEKSIFAKKEGGTDVGNALRAINPFKKKGPKTQTTSDVLSASDFDMEGSMLMKRKPLKKNFFNK